MTREDIKRENIVYYARIIPTTGIYEVCELKIRTVDDNYFVGTDKHDKQAYLFTYDKLDKTIFTNRSKALQIVKDAELRE